MKRMRSPRTGTHRFLAIVGGVIRSLFLLASLSAGNTLFSQQIDPYAGKPKWYRPGHPLDPAEPGAIKTLPGFAVEKLLGIPREVGSLTTMTVDGNGDLIVATQHTQGLYRITPSPIGSGQSSRLEPMKGEAADFGWSQGLLWAFDSLYVTVAEQNPLHPTGLYRLRDTDRDGKYDFSEKLFDLKGAGEHGPHNLVAGPDGESLYLVCGNGTPVPAEIKDRGTVRTGGADHLMPPGFENTEHTDAAWVARFDPDGSAPELVAGGMRNPYDIAFNNRGDLFTFDADMEYDLGTPWYRPNRICHVVSGGEFGWRAGAGKWPEHYADSVPPVVNIGLASPTGLVFGYKAAFPEKFRNALFALDWTFAVIYAVHLKPSGAGYAAEFEEFASGVGLPLTDVVIGKDGALYFCVGGRRLGSAVYRIWHTGSEAVAGENPNEAPNPASRLRWKLEAYHGKKNQDALAAAWPHLGSEDPAIRYAARIAVESQPVAEWGDRVFAESGGQAKRTALLALARQGDHGDLRRVIEALPSISPAAGEDLLLAVLRIYELALARGGDELKSSARANIAPVRELLPHPSALVNRELARILCYLGDATAIDPLLGLMEQDTGQTVTRGSGLVERNLVYGAAVLNMMESAPMVERMHHAQMLNWLRSGWTLDQRKRYFALVVEAMQTSKGGAGYRPAWQHILDTSRETLTEKEKDALQSIWAPLENIAPIPSPKGPGRLWQADYFLKKVENGFGKRDFENGHKMFAAAGCIACHGMKGEGGVSGPDLTSVGQRFTIKDLLASIIEPSEAISDQYRIMIVTVNSGETLTGRIYSKDAEKTVLSPNAMKPNVTRTLRNADIASLMPLPVSTMPPALLNALNEEEVLDLLAYLLAGGQGAHAVFAGGGG